MLVVKVEIWPGGSKERAYEVGRLSAGNISDCADVSSYEIRLSDRQGLAGGMARESSGRPSDDDAKKAFGRDLYHWASRSQHPFRNRHEQWLCSGSYQILADGVTVGWHPDHGAMFGVSSKDEAA